MALDEFSPSSGIMVIHKWYICMRTQAEHKTPPQLYPVTGWNAAEIRHKWKWSRVLARLELIGCSAHTHCSNIPRTKRAMWRTSKRLATIERVSKCADEALSMAESSSWWRSRGAVQWQRHCMPHMYASYCVYRLSNAYNVVIFSDQASLIAHHTSHSL